MDSFNGNTLYSKTRLVRECFQIFLNIPKNENGPPFWIKSASKFVIIQTPISRARTICNRIFAYFSRNFAILHVLEQKECSLN